MKAKMKNLLFIFLIQIICSSIYAQKHFTLGIDWVFYSSETSNAIKLDNFNKGSGLQLTYRKNIYNNNFLTLKLTGVESSKNLYNLQSLRVGYEVGNIHKIKNLFLITELGINRFNSIKLSKSSYTIAPSLGIAYNLNLNKYFILRASNVIEFNLPTNIGSFFSNSSFGLHYKFNKEKTVNGKDN